MSAKWRALQHRHRYTYSAVIFPPSFLNSMSSLPPNLLSLKFFTELHNLVSLSSTYAQLAHAKKLASAFNELLLGSSHADEGLVYEASRFYLEVLFLENSLPLHRTLVSVLAKTRNFKDLISGCFRELCEKFADVKGKRFCVSRAALSMMGSPKLGYLVDIVEECAVLVCWDIVLGLNSVISEIRDWSRPSPVVMEQCQEALSCLYYLLQRFPNKFTGLREGMNGESISVLEMVITVILKVLKSHAFSRDCFVAAGVSFCAALQVCLSPHELCVYIMEGVFYQKVFDETQSECGFKDTKVAYEGDLFAEIRNLSVLSRLCLIRGILTAVSRTVLNTGLTVLACDPDTTEDGSTSIQTILFDGVLPELCHYCENPSDSHFNFHALTVMQICLQQIKTLLLTEVANTAKDYDPVSEDMGARILKIVWNNLEDSLSQTVKQVHLIFDLFLDIQTNVHWAEGSEKIKLYLQKITSDLLCLGPRCKGRYVPLASLTRRLGAKTILKMCDDLLFQTIHAYSDDDVCCAATLFLKCFLECFRDECWSNEGIEEGYITLRRQCLPPFLFGLANGVPKLRTNLNTYALPVLLEVDVDSIFPMLAFISVGDKTEEADFLYPELSRASSHLSLESKVAILVSLLKASRLLALLEGDIDLCEDFSVSENEYRLEIGQNDVHALVCIKGVKLKVLIEWLVLALIHLDDSLRVDAAETLFLNPKTSSLPSNLELKLMKAAIPLNMRSCSTAFQMKWSSLFRKFFCRVRTALERQFKQGNWHPSVKCSSTESHPIKRTAENIVCGANDLFLFMRWLSCFLFFSCYPSAPYERKIVAMDLILILTDVWPIVPSLGGSSDSVSSEKILYPYNEGIILPDSTLLLVGSIIDSWDRLRENSFRILLRFPNPLPGISTNILVEEVTRWAKRLVCSPRVRESDAGALTLRLLFRKYVLDLSWIVRISVDVNCISLQSDTSNGKCKSGTTMFPVIEYVVSLINWLQAIVEEAETDLAESCKKSFVHGVLLTLRYTFEELDWNSDVVLCSMSEMRQALEKLLELIMRITSLALWVVSADAWYLPEDMDEMIDDDAFLVEEPSGTSSTMSSSEPDVKYSKHTEDTRSFDQIVMVGCWLAMKEVSLLLGTIIRKIPLPTGSDLNFSSSEGSFCEAADPDVMLDLKQLEKIGNHFLEVLLKMKHNGAIDKTRAGFTALCNRLLCSNDPSLCKLTESWMEQLMERIVSKDQVVDDLLRRSAGIPAAFTALFLSEPEGTPKKLLPRALRWLIDVANRSLMGASEASKISSYTSSAGLEQENLCRVLPEFANGKASKVRDDGVIPTVHVFNVLKAAFNDANLATDTSGFSSEALIISIRSFSSSYWEIRNSATLAYTALVRRMIGFLNIQKRESARRALTGLEFFHRYPSLHAFLLNELEVATESLTSGTTENFACSLANLVHPSLCPMLILLSRLKPSTIDSETGDPLDPFLFMQFIRKCSTQSNLKVRVLASRALTSLVSNEKLSRVLLNLISELPCEAYSKSSNSVHGTLLQLSSLLDNNCRHLADFHQKEQIIGDLLPGLVACSWIGSPRLCSCPILNASFLRVLDHMLGIARTNGISKSLLVIRNLSMKLSTECLDVEEFRKISFYDPTIAELCKQAAACYFSCVFQVSEGGHVVLNPQIYSPPALNFTGKPENGEVFEMFSGVQERLILSMSHASYEVRLATLKWLFRLLDSIESGREASDQLTGEIRLVLHWAKVNLQDTLLMLLDVEKNHKCTCYILRILFIWNFQLLQTPEDQLCSQTSFVGTMDFDSVFKFWNKLISFYEITRHTKTRQMLICCMGICVKRLAGLFLNSLVSDVVKETTRCAENVNVEKWVDLYECIACFVNLIEQHSASSEPVSMRKAAAESTVASGLLEHAALLGPFVSNKYLSSEKLCSPLELQEALNAYASKILILWFMCIKLLEDEDLDIRQRLAMDVQQILTLKRSTRSTKSGVVPTQVEKVIELSFEFLSSVFGHWLEYLNNLLQRISGSANYIASEGDLVRRVFDKEIDNHHEEKLLICQICCSHLEKLSKSLIPAGLLDRHVVENFFTKWRNKFFQQLMLFADDHTKKMGGVSWIGGVGNHKDAFLPLYANLLGIYVVTRCIFDAETTSGKSLLSDMIELGGKISPFLRNPLICNLYLLVVSLHEQMGEFPIDNLIFEGTKNIAIWDGFDPYFLLR